MSWMTTQADKSTSSDQGLQWTSVISHPVHARGPPGIPSRSDQIKALKTSNQVFDVLVVGGGATGAGIALDAASRNMSVACIERGDFGSETSSRSTKLIWAGIKYMGTAVASLLSSDLITKPSHTLSNFASEMRMVRQCHVERHYMVTKQQHLCHWIPIAVPFTSWYITPPPLGQPLFSFFPVLAPLTFKIYDALSGFKCPHSYLMMPSKIREVFPQLEPDNLKYCAVFYEAQHNDSRTNLAIAMSAASHGAKIANYVQMETLTRGDDGKVNGCVATDLMTGDQFNVRARQVVFAGGPFTDELRKQESEQDFKPAVRSASGAHIVVPRSVVPDNMGLLDVNTSDGRFMFILPWLKHTLIGTTDLKSKAQTLPTAPEDHIDFLLKEARRYLKADHLNRSDVSSAWQGWRPLAIDPHAAPDSPVSRDHVIARNPDTGVVFVAGGKWTTWREMAEEATDLVASQLFLSKPTCQTLEIGLHGADGFHTQLCENLQKEYGLEAEIADHLVSTYGGLVSEVSVDNYNLRKPIVEGFPYLEAEVKFACREYACTIEDVVSRRTRLAFLDVEAALAAIPRVADIMQHELGWSSKVKRKQMEAAKQYVMSYNGRSPTF